MEQGKEYYAFISYKREDEKWAKWLQDKLEHYKFPTNLNGRTDLPKNIRPTFRDVTDLNPGLLAEEIDNALRNSEWLIVVCSPRSAKSPWVCKEAQTFIDLGRADHIIPFVIEGNPFSNDTATECYPEALLNLTGSKELLAANINEMGRDAAAIKVVARMFNLRFDALWQRYEREQRRKKWMWIGGSMLLALLGLGIGAYFVKQNRTIENQNVQLKVATVNQDVSLAKAYLSQNRPEMALTFLWNIEDNVDLLDSMLLTEFNSVRLSICDSILSNQMLLVDISDTIGMEHRDVRELLTRNTIANIHFSKGAGGDVAIIYDREKNAVDTICDWPVLKFEMNTNMTHFAVYNGYGREPEDFYDFDIVYDPMKAGIRIYSLRTGRVEYFVSCYGWYPQMVYPMGVSNDGKSIIYREGHRSFERICFVDFNKEERIPLETWYCNSSESVKSGFSPNGKYFYLFYQERKEIVVFSTMSKNAIHTFKYEDCDSVFWNDSNQISVSSKGKVYSWELKSKKRNCIINIVSFADNVNLSKDGRYGSAACNNGIIYIWDISTGKTLFEQKVMDYPQDVAFTNDGKFLWVISGYGDISVINIESKTIKDVENPNYESPPHPWPYYLQMTKNGKYCIEVSGVTERYSLFDIHGKFIEGGVLGESASGAQNEFVFPEKFAFDPESPDGDKIELTARRFSLDGNMCIEGYSNGVIKVFSIQERDYIRTLIMREDCNSSVDYDRK